MTKEKNRFGDEERTVMHLVPAAAVKLMKRRVLSRPGVRPLLYHARLSCTPVITCNKPRDVIREGKVHGRLNASWKICCLAVNGQSFLVIDGYLISFSKPRSYIPREGITVFPIARVNNSVANNNVLTG